MIRGLIALIISMTSVASVSGQSREKLPPPASEAVSAISAQTGGIRIAFPEMRLIVKDVKPEDFRVSVAGRSSVVGYRGLEEIDGRTISIETTEITDLSARVRFEFGALQYLTDNSPAGPIDFSRESPWTEIKISDNVLHLPEFNPNGENTVSVFEQLGFKSRDQFEKYFEGQHFAKIKAISYPLQKNFYTKLLTTDRTRFEKCCPEYIEQAKEFLSRPADGFKTFRDLGLEIVLQKLTLEISGVTRDGKRLSFELVGIRDWAR